MAEHLFGPVCQQSVTHVHGRGWTLLLIRDIGLFGRHRNKDFQGGARVVGARLVPAGWSMADAGEVSGGNHSTR